MTAIAVEFEDAVGGGKWRVWVGGGSGLLCFEVCGDQGTPTSRERDGSAAEYHGLPKQFEHKHKYFKREFAQLAQGAG